MKDVQGDVRERTSPEVSPPTNWISRYDNGYLWIFREKSRVISMDINYKVKTKKSFENAVNSLKESLINHNFGVLWELNFKEKLKEKGLSFDDNFKILEVCNPKKAQEVLVKNIEAGYFLPCKMVVYEYNNFVFIGMVNPTRLIGMINNDELSAMAIEVENELKSVIDEAK
ncbi:MAG: DUF302 domain-containing protein [Bacillota bacterium]|nr:DUF302 domain-containing protein [Bacillota bacterium]